MRTNRTSASSSWKYLYSTLICVLEDNTRTVNRACISSVILRFQRISSHAVALKEPRVVVRRAVFNNMPERDENGQFSGGLYIREKDGNWNLRYFILDEGSCLLRYFDRNKSKDVVWDNCEGEINIRFITKIEDKFKTEDSIEIQTYESKYYLRADNRSDLDDWIKLLRKTAVDPSKRQGSLKRLTVPTSSGEPTNENEPMDTSDKQKPEEAVCYQTKIIGGVVVKTPVRKVSDVEDDEARLRTASGGPVTTMKPLKEGFLVKKGALVKNWKRRYFRLDSVKLSYYEKDTDRDPLKSISTAEIHQVRRQQSSSSDVIREHIFEVITQNRTYYIQAETPEEMESWMSAIKRVTINRGRAVTDPDTVVGRHKGHGSSQSYKFTTAM